MIILDRTPLTDRPVIFGITGTDLAQYAKSRGWVISGASAQTYLSDLKLMGYINNDAGAAGSWYLTEAGLELARQSQST